MVNNKNKQIMDSINRYLRRVNNSFPIEKAYMFGSYANGTAHKESDIDIAIISSSFSGNSFHDSVKAGALTWGIDTRIEVVTFRPEDFNNQNLLASEIISNGIELKLS
jgi:predicted nucleotidyltransferase